MFIDRARVFVGPVTVGMACLASAVRNTCQMAALVAAMVSRGQTLFLKRTEY